MTTYSNAVAAQAKTKLQAMIDAGKARTTRGIEALHREFQIRRDMMVKPSAMTIEVADDGTIHPVIGADRFNLTGHARGQLLSTAGIPTRFADDLAVPELRDLLKTNVERLLVHNAADGMLVREVQGTVKGVLSPSYRRMDMSPMFEAFIRESLAAGLVPHSGEVTDTRAFATFMQTQVIELLPNEFVVAAVELRGSDYGNGALDLALSLWRLLCSNGAIGASMFRKVHLGKRFEDFGSSNVVKLSERTQNLDQKTIQSGLRDAMKSLPAHLDATVETLREHAAKSVNLTDALAKLTKAGLRKATVEKVKALYETEQPIEALPQTPGAWRFSNVLSLIANSASGDEAHDLREVAFDMAVA